MSKYKNKFSMNSVREHGNKVSEEYYQNLMIFIQMFREAIKYMNL